VGTFFLLCAEEWSRRTISSMKQTLELQEGGGNVEHYVGSDQLVVPRGLMSCDRAMIAWLTACLTASLPT
jgi:hypothetical protein